MITNTTFTFSRLPLAVAFSLSLTACETDGTSILDLESLFPQEVFTATLPESQPTLDNPAGTEIVDETETNINTPSSPTELSDNQIPAELALLTENEVIMESRFGGNGEPIEVRFRLPASSYELSPDGDFGSVQSNSGTEITACAYIFVTTQYLCLHSFDLEISERVWYLFTLQDNTNGAGIFEFCTIEFTTDDCLEKLFEDPDGTVSVTIDRNNSINTLANAAPYFSYENQGTFAYRSTNPFIEDHYTNAMNTLVTTVENAKVP